MQNKELKIVRFIKKVPGHTIGKVITADPREIYKLLKDGTVTEVTEAELDQYKAKLQAASRPAQARTLDPGPEKGKMLYGENGTPDCPDCKGKKVGCPDCDKKKKAKIKKNVKSKTKKKADSKAGPKN